MTIDLRFRQAKATAVCGVPKWYQWDDRLCQICWFSFTTHWWKLWLWNGEPLLSFPSFTIFHSAFCEWNWMLILQLYWLCKTLKYLQYGLELINYWVIKNCRILRECWLFVTCDSCLHVNDILNDEIKLAVPMKC